MKILFIENRYKTSFWELIADRLISKGHEVYWIVQNHFFKPKTGTIRILPYYNNQPIYNKEYTSEIVKIIKSNRGLNYFGIKSDNFIFYYQKKIEVILEEVKPDVAFGESTLFHELLAINECKKRNILYLNPCTCRYPNGRFSFYKYDTLEPFGGSGEKLTDEEAWGIISKIVDRSIMPDYMQTIKPKLPLIDSLRDKVLLSTSYLAGERYNTPSPIKKRIIERKRESLIKKWDTLASSQIDNNNKYKILYPMQMQPEANIDVWGYPYNNQIDIIKRVSSKLSKKQVLYIKPNPKSKYEITDEIIEYAQSNSDKIVLIRHDIPMQQVFPYIDFVITVTGTIAFECIWSDKPFISLGAGFQKSYSLNKDLETFLATYYNTVYQNLSKAEKINLINKLNTNSYKGKIIDPKTELTTDSSDNLSHVLFGFIDVLKKLNRHDN